MEARNERLTSLMADAPEMLQLLHELWEHDMPDSEVESCDVPAMWDRVFEMLKKHKEHLS